MMNTVVDELSPEKLREALGCFTTGVAVVTGIHPEKGAVGLTISSFNSLSLDPPLIIWSLALQSGSLSAFTTGSPFVVNILSEAQHATCLQFARSGTDKFRDISITPGLGGILVALCLSDRTTLGRRWFFMRQRLQGCRFPNRGCAVRSGWFQTRVTTSAASVGCWTWVQTVSIGRMTGGTVRILDVDYRTYKGFNNRIEGSHRLTRKREKILPDLNTEAFVDAISAPDARCDR